MTDISTLQLETQYHIHQRIEDYLDSDILPNIEQLVEETKLYQSRMGNAQFSSLQNLLRETNSVHVVLNWISYQMGRHSVWREERFGAKLLDELRQLESFAEGIVEEIGQPVLDRLYSSNVDLGKRRLIRSTWKRLIEQYVGQLYRKLVARRGAVS